jgi:hypothetical protein
MPRYAPSSAGLTPGKRVGVGPKSKVALGPAPRSFALIYVEDGEAKVRLSLSEEASVGEGPVIQNADGFVILRGYDGAISLASEGEGSNEVQKVTVEEAEAGSTFTLTYEGKTTAAIAFDAEPEALGEALEALSTIGAGNVKVEGEAGAWTVEFIEDLKAYDAALLKADGAELKGAEASITVSVETAGGLAVQVAEG